MKKERPNLVGCDTAGSNAPTCPQKSETTSSREAGPILNHMSRDKTTSYIIFSRKRRISVVVH